MHRRGWHCAAQLAETEQIEIDNATNQLSIVIRSFPSPIWTFTGEEWTTPPRFTV
jgi:hypothetical protein